MKCVAVYVKGIEAGVLARFRQGGYEFRYTRRYRESSRPSVAFSLSKRKAVYRSNVLFPFFYGLLAEGEQKRVQCRTMRIDENDHYTRLAETCREGAIGAVYVLPR
jgi:serine/threonine-protein kinase HipA